MKHTLLLLTCLLGMTACQHTNVHNVVKDIAEQPVDTSYYSQERIVLPAFTAVEINCFADVTYHSCAASTPPSIRILAPQKMLKLYSAHVDDEGTMVLTMNTRTGLSDQAVPVIHIYAPTVNAFELNGGKCLRFGALQLHSPLQVKLNGVGIITSQELKATSVEVELNGAGNMELHGIHTTRLKARLNGAGHIKLVGKAREKHISIDGSGSIDTSELKK